MTDWIPDAAASSKRDVEEVVDSNEEEEGGAPRRGGGWAQHSWRGITGENHVALFLPLYQVWISTSRLASLSSHVSTHTHTQDFTRRWWLIFEIVTYVVFFPLHSLTHTSIPCSSAFIGAAEALVEAQECSVAAPFFLGTTAAYLLGLVLFRVPFMSRLDRILSLTVGFLQMVTALLLVLGVAEDNADALSGMVLMLQILVTLRGLVDVGKSIL